jgi:hypothetical protein
MTPDRTIVRALKRIDRKLSVQWDEGHECWAIYHDLPEGLGRVDELVEKMATELQLTYLEQGYVVPREEAGRNCLVAVKRAALVCYVVNDDGSFRPLDGRIVEKLRRMDHLRQNCGLRDWRELLAAGRYAQERAAELAREDFYAYQNRDAVLQRVLSDVLWEIPVTRSVYMKRPEDEGSDEPLLPENGDEEEDEEKKHLPPEEQPNEKAEKDPGLSTHPTR